MSTITHSLFRYRDDWNAAQSTYTIPSSKALTQGEQAANEKTRARILTLDDAARELASGAKIYSTPARQIADRVKALLGMPLIVDVTELSDKVDSGEIKPGAITAMARRFLLPVNPSAIGQSAGRNGYDDNEQILSNYILIANLNEENADLLLAKAEELRSHHSDLTVEDYRQLWQLAESLQLKQGMANSDVYSPPSTYTPSDLTPINVNKYGEGSYLKAGKNVPFILIEGGNFCFLTASGPQKARDGKIVAVLKDGLWHGLQLEVFLRDNIKPDGTPLTENDVKNFPTVTVVELLGARPIGKLKGTFARNQLDR